MLHSLPDKDDISELSELLKGLSGITRRPSGWGSINPPGSRHGPFMPGHPHEPLGLSKLLPASNPMILEAFALGQHHLGA